jgi:GH15 family glucan-1,4-alpha-glucosidase
MSRSPIADYALLSDCHSAALVHRSGTVEWLCCPRYDGASVFARLLDDRAGHWTLSLPDAHLVRRSYLDGTLVLETVFESASGRMVLTDALAIGVEQSHQNFGRRAPHVLLRQARCTAGEVVLDVEFAPRPDYGRASPALRNGTGGLRADGTPPLQLSGPRLEVADGVARGRLRLRAGESHAFALHLRGGQDGHGFWDEARTAQRLDETIAAWRSWSQHHLHYQGPWRDLVSVSGRVLKGLTYQPTGAIIAAPTTSLPETVGGVRNWDYRYTWVRDASLTLEALWVAACPDEANRFFDFLAGAARRQLEEEGDLQIMFGVTGERDLTERELPHLAGWRDSRPVRIGNGAWHQRQLDVYGELLGAVYRLREQIGQLTPGTAAFLTAVADTALHRWHEPDHGIWEMRDEPRHFLHSKLLCWVALDRASELAGMLGADAATVERWTAGRDEIRRAILEQGWNDRLGTFTQSFGSDALDASALLIPIVGFLPASDARVRATIDLIARQLTDDHGLVYRYRTADGLPGQEGAFLLCTFWLARAQALAGEVARARATFERAAAFVNDLGLLAEEVNAGTGELLGNFPQAFSHVGLVTAAWAIAQAEQGQAPPPTTGALR